MGAEEGILYAECNLDIGIQMKLRHDFAGHYNRPDIFHLQINRTAPRLYSVHGGGERALSNAQAQRVRLESGPSPLLASPGEDMISEDGSPLSSKPGER
jgi:aliphatic nitrilase